MCGRFNIISSPLTQFIMSIIEEHGSSEQAVQNAGSGDVLKLETRYNISPTDQVPVILRSSDNKLLVRDMRWWFVPAWTRQIESKYTMFNARSESLKTSRAFQTAYKRRRCIIPASGYFEWQKIGSKKYPYYLHPDSSPGFAFAGLWEAWQGKTPEGERVSLESCTVITSAAPVELKEIHSRIPVYLMPEEIGVWLNEFSTEDALSKVLVPCHKMPISVTPVSSYVGNSKNKGSQCISAVAEARIIFPL